MRTKIFPARNDMNYYSVLYIKDIFRVLRSQVELVPQSEFISQPSAREGDSNQPIQGRLFSSLYEDIRGAVQRNKNTNILWNDDHVVSLNLSLDSYGYTQIKQHDFEE